MKNKRRVTTGGQKGDIDAAKGDIDAGPLFVLPVNDPSGEPPPPNPLPREGAQELEFARAVDAVCSALGIGNRRRRKLLRDVIALEAEKGDLPATIALAMIAAWRRKAELGDLLYPCRLERFFGDPIWKDERQWPWDKQRLRDIERGREARVGS